MLVTIAAGIFIAESIAAIIILLKLHKSWKEARAIVEINARRMELLGRAATSFCATVGELAAV